MLVFVFLLFLVGVQAGLVGRGTSSFGGFLVVRSVL